MALMSESIPPPLISLCMMVRNEARFLERCLASAEGIAGQRVVVDTGSTDATVQIATEAGAEVHYWPWRDDFSLARNHTLSHATGQWILILDGDEVLDPSAAAALAELDLGPAGPDAYQFRIINYTTDRMIEAESSGLNQTRLFRNTPRFRYRCNVHNRLTDLETGLPVIGPVVDVRVHHYGYIPSVWSHQNKNARLTLLEAAVAESPDDPLCHYHLANHLKILERWGEALAHFERVVAVQDRNQDWVQIAHFSAAFCASKHGRHDRALDLCDALLAADPWLADAHVRRAEALMALGENDAAAAGLQALLAADGRHAIKSVALNFAAPYRLGRALHLLGRDHEAAQIFETLATPECDDPTVWCHLSLCRARADDLPGARHALAEGLERAPDDEDLLQLEAAFGAAPEDPIAKLQRQLTDDPSDPTAWNDLGVRLFESGQPEAARHALMEAVKRAPTDINALTNLKAVCEWLLAQSQ